MEIYNFESIDRKMVAAITFSITVEALNETYRYNSELNYR